MWIELKIIISHPKTLKMWTSIDSEFLAGATIALFAPRPMLIHQQKFLQISAARMLLCSSLVQDAFADGCHFLFCSHMKFPTFRHTRYD